MRSRVQAVLGIDAGTTSVKSVVISTTGDVLGTARSAVRIRRPQPHCAEQDMDEVWSAVAQTISAALAEAGNVELLALSVTGQGDGAWLVDAGGRPAG
ncbi:FGGY family carbohydrate kinase, partial [Streptomyces sp. JV185]